MTDREKALAYFRSREAQTPMPGARAMFQEAIKALEQPEVIRCKDCKHRHLDGMTWNCPFGLSGGEDFFCSYGAKDGDLDDE